MSGACAIPHARTAGGFTLVEVMASLLVILVGMLAVIGMVSFAIAQANRSQAACTAMATALSVVDDPLPLGTLDWNHAVAPLAGGSAVTTGFINGYFVRRTETSDGLVAEGLASVAISVDVFEANGGVLVASTSTRRMHRN